jgi:large subunit ribosomal protein L29
MKPKEIRGMDKNTLNEKMLELKKDLIKMNAQVAIGTALKNPGQVRKIKKTIARILTISSGKKIKKTLGGG